MPAAIAKQYHAAAIEASLGTLRKAAINMHAAFEITQAFELGR